jgi:transposase InsO family protein
MEKHGAVQSLKVNKDLEAYDCVPCDVGKDRAMVYGPKAQRATRALEWICVDVDSIKTKAACGSTMFMLVVDEYSRYKWVFLLKSKDEAAGHLITLTRRLNTAFTHRQLRVQDIFSNQGSEFMNKYVEGHCRDEGIEIRTSNAYSAQESGFVERGNGVVTEKLRVVLEETQVPFELWGEALPHIVDTLNIIASRIIHNKTPHERQARRVTLAYLGMRSGCDRYGRQAEEEGQTQEKEGAWSIDWVLSSHEGIQMDERSRWVSRYGAGRQHHLQRGLHYRRRFCEEDDPERVWRR